MEALDLLQLRRSSKKFGEMAPNPQQLEEILQAGLRAPDHGRLKPYRFIVIEQQAREKYAEYLTQAAIEFEMGEEGLAKATKLATQAPMIIGVVAKITKEIAKVPAWEQMISAGCAAYAIELAANAQGFETCWISNKWVNGSALRQAFGCEEWDKVIGLIMLGSPQDKTDITLASQPEEVGDYVSYLK